MMNDLHPELKSLSRDLNEITDWDDMRLAKLGGRAIHSILDHAYPTKEHYTVNDLDDWSVPHYDSYDHDKIATNPAHELLKSSGVFGSLKAARPS